MVDLVRRALLAAAGAAVAAPGLRAKAEDGPPVLFSGGGQYTELDPVPAAPDRPIETIDGTVVDFARFRGRVVVLNFWATWCAACVPEMPALDRLAAVQAERGLAVLPVAMDRGGRVSVTAFLRRHHLPHLPVVTDPAEHIGHFRTGNPNGAPFALVALPVTYLIDRTSRVRGYLPGAVDWQSDAARSLLDFIAAT
jgi:thiol-disulfide isomerase/thioredoxin